MRVAVLSALQAARRKSGVSTVSTGFCWFEQEIPFCGLIIWDCWKTGCFTRDYSQYNIDLIQSIPSEAIHTHRVKENTGADPVTFVKIVLFIINY